MSVHLHMLRGHIKGVPIYRQGTLGAIDLPTPDSVGESAVAIILGRKAVPDPGLIMPRG